MRPAKRNRTGSRRPPTPKVGSNSGVSEHSRDLSCGKRQYGCDESFIHRCDTCDGTYRMDRDLDEGERAICPTCGINLFRDMS